MPARIVLLHGNDSVRSLAQLNSWKSQFRTKYPEAEMQIITGLSNASIEQLQGLFAASSMFSPQQMAIIHRPTATEKGVSRPVTKALIAWLSDRVNRVQEQGSTILVWEDLQLAASHPLLQWFAEREARGVTKIFVNTSPMNRTLCEKVVHGLKLMGYQVDSGFSRALDSQLQLVEKQQRTMLRIKSQDPIPRDERPWVIEQVLAQVPLLLKDDEMTVKSEHLTMLFGVNKDVATVFEVANALRDKRFPLAIQYIQTWDLDDISSVLALAAIIKRTGSGMRSLAALLGDLELILKNGLLPARMAAQLFVIQLARGNRTLVSSRVMWLASIHR
jgi:hypothetical protein